MKKCPYCAEEIQDEAILCRYCKRDLPSSVTVSKFEPTRRSNNCLKIIFAILILLIALIVIRSAFNRRAQNASVVQVKDDYVSQLFMVDRLIHISETPELGKDFEYTGVVKVGQMCNVLQAEYYKSQLQYKLDCSGTIGWLPSDSVEVLK